MPLPDAVDRDKLAEAALAILSLDTWDEDNSTRAFKGMDWDLLKLLYQRGWISDPVGKENYLVITELGLSLAETFLQKHFGE